MMDTSFVSLHRPFTDPWSRVLSGGDSLTLVCPKASGSEELTLLKGRPLGVNLGYRHSSTPWHGTSQNPAGLSFFFFFLFLIPIDNLYALKTREAFPEISGPQQIPKCTTDLIVPRRLTSIPSDVPISLKRATMFPCSDQPLDLSLSLPSPHLCNQSTCRSGLPHLCMLHPSMESSKSSLSSVSELQTSPELFSLSHKSFSIQLSGWKSLFLPVFERLQEHEAVVGR